MDEDLEKEDAALPPVVDQARQRLSGLNYPEASLDVGGSHAIELAARATASMKVSLGLLSGADASSYLETPIPLVIQEILSKQNAYSSIRWLWYLRRLPAEFFGGIYVTTIGYDRGLAESLTWFSTGGDADNSDKQVNFRIDDSAIRHVCRYVAAVKVLSHLQIAYRRVGKGASLDTRKRIPFAETPPKVDEAIRVYDIRHDDIGGSRLQGLGLSEVETDARVLSAELDAKDLFGAFWVSNWSAKIANFSPMYGLYWAVARTPWSFA